MSDRGGGAVFLSYASQDAEAVARLAEALRANGVEVWFDRNELVGGDAWDAKIRGQIASCALFVPVISANTQARLEGYFRIEWKLAARRTHAMATARAFLLPVVIDDTRDAEAHVPDEFREVQWTRLPGGEAPPAFVARMAKLMAGEITKPEVKPAVAAPARTPADAARKRSTPTALRLSAAIAIAVLAAVAIWRPWAAKPLPGSTETRGAESAAGANSMPEVRRLTEQARALLERPGGGLAKYETATVLCDRALALDPSDVEALAIASQVDTSTARANYDRTQSRIDAARAKAARAINLAPRAFEARLAQAWFLVNFGGALAAQAEPLLLALNAERTRHPLVIEALVTLRQMQGRHAEADELAEQTISLGGFAAAGALNSRAGARIRRREFAAAESDIDRALEFHRFTGNVGMKIFLRLCWHGDLEGAKAAWGEMPVDEATENFAVSAAVRLYRWRREPEELLRLLGALPRDWITTLNGPKAALTGDAHAALQRPVAAQEDWRQALALVEKRLQETPNDRNLLEWKAYLEASLRENSRLAATLQRLREMPASGGINYYEKLPRWATADEVLTELETRARAAKGELPGAPLTRSYALTTADLRLNPAWDVVRALPRFRALLAACEADRRFSPAAEVVSGVGVRPTQGDAAGEAGASAGGRSVAVLAFKNLSGDPAREFFSDGLSEAVTEVLGRVPGLKVVGSASAFSFKGKAVPIPEIARQLGVTHLVEGTVLQEGQTVRITAKLTQADGFQVWVSDKLEREAKNIFALHDEVSGLIAKNLSLKLGASSAASTAAVNPQAFELYLQGRQAWNRRTLEDYRRAEELFSRAIDLDPSFARAHVGRADARTFLAVRRGQAGTWGQRNAPQLAQLAEDLRQALQLDPDLAEGHASLGNLHGYRGQREEAQRSLERAIALNANYATAHQWLGLHFWRQGKLPEARASVLRAVEADPLSSVISAACSVVLQDVGEVAAALIHAERAVALQPDSWRALSAKSTALWTVGRKDEAVAVARLVAENDSTPQGLGRALFVLGRAGLVADVETRRNTGGGAAGLVRLQGALALGRWEEFFSEWGPNQLTVDDPWYLYVPELDAVRGNARFLAVLKEAGLTEAHARAQAWRVANPPEKVEAKR